MNALEQFQDKHKQLKKHLAFLHRLNKADDFHINYSTDYMYVSQLTVEAKALVVEALRVEFQATEEELRTVEEKLAAIEVLLRE